MADNYWFLKAQAQAHIKEPGDKTEQEKLDEQNKPKWLSVLRSHPELFCVIVLCFPLVQLY